MMIGNYPCCDEPLMIALPDVRLPTYVPDVCPKCGANVWHKMSRVDPTSLTDEDFHKEFVVDEVTKSIKPRSEAA